MTPWERDANVIRIIILLSIAATALTLAWINA